MDGKINISGGRAGAPERDPPRSSADDRRRIDSQDLLGAAGEVLIWHKGREYRLRVTQNGKLILTA